MPSICVGDNVELFYEDSGPLSSAMYTTYVCIHGTAFNGGVFKRLFPLARDHDIRVISIYRRDYPPSTPFRPTETQLLSEGAEGQTKFLREQGNELAMFLDSLIQTNNIPPVREISEKGGSNGGIVIIGWSLGSLMPLAMLAHIESISPEARQRLSEYVHTIILHDTGTYTFGYPNPPEWDISPWIEPNPVKYFKHFLNWVTGYYEHEDPGSGLFEKLEFDTPGGKAHTFSDTPSDELQALLCPGPHRGSDLSILQIDAKVYNQTTHRALFDKALAGMLPKVRVRFLTSAESPGVLIYAPSLLQKNIVEASLIGRDIGFLLTDSGNHFVHWDMPKEALEFYHRCIHE